MQRYQQYTRKLAASIGDVSGSYLDRSRTPDRRSRSAETLRRIRLQSDRGRA